MDGVLSFHIGPLGVLRGVAQDWHIDFAGSSVYYHILKGSKVRGPPLPCDMR